jgi:hypothetical protein
LSKNEVDLLARFLLEKPHEPEDTEEAMKTELWTGESFVSPLLVQEVFRELLLTFPCKRSDRTSGKSSPVVEQVIAAGLANMRALDFEESDFSTLDNKERGLAFRWGACGGSALKNQVWHTSEVVTEERIRMAGAKPAYDFVM